MVFFIILGVFKMQELQNLSETLSSLLEQFKVEHDKHYAGNSSAGARARKIIGQIKAICSPYRKVSNELDKFRKEQKKSS